MIWRAATRSSADGFSSSSFSSGEGRSGSTIRPRMFSSTRALQRQRQEPVVGAVEQVVVEAGVELGPGEDHQAHARPGRGGPGARPARASGRRRWPGRARRRVPGAGRGNPAPGRPRRARPPPRRCRSTAARPGNRPRSRTAPTTARRRPGGSAASPSPARRPALVVAGQLVVGELEREVVRTGAGKGNGQRAREPSGAARSRAA